MAQNNQNNGTKQKLADMNDEQVFAMARSASNTEVAGVIACVRNLGMTVEMKSDDAIYSALLNTKFDHLLTIRTQHQAKRSDTLDYTSFLRSRGVEVPAQTQAPIQAPVQQVAVTAEQAQVPTFTAPTVIPTAQAVPQT